MKRIVTACLFVTALLGLSWLALADSAPTPEPVRLTVTAAPARTAAPMPVPTDTPLPTDTPAPGDSEDPFTATLTPEATFVPLPTSTPNADGTTPTPAPPRTTPYPSPEEVLFTLPETVLLGTVTEQEVTLRARASVQSSKRGTLHYGDTVRVCDSVEGWYRIESGSVSAWISADALEADEYTLREAEHTTVRIGSLNIHSARTWENIREIADALAMENLDVVGLQEVTVTRRTDWVQQLAREADYPYYYFSETVNRNNGAYGIAILSRFPILFAETFRLDGYPGDEPRVMQYTALLTDKGVIHYLNTHLSAAEMYKKSVNLASMVYYVRALGVGTLAVTGDFNCGPPRLIEFWPDVHFANMTVNTYGDGSVPKILDNVLYTGRIRVVRVTYKPLEGVTDHSLVAAELIYD